MTNVVHLFATHDIPTMLRLMADRIEAGELGEISAMIGITITDEDDVELYGWGPDQTTREVLGAMRLAEHALIHGGNDD